MADVFSKRKRSAVMSRIRGSGNRATELALLRVFRRHGLTGWRRGAVIRDQKSEVRRQNAAAGRQTVEGKRPARFAVRPDFVFPELKLAVFVDGCFWHGCPQHATKPKHNAAFWRKKLAANRTRDQLVNRTLRARGWNVLRIWEHELRRKNEARLVARLFRHLAPAPNADRR